MSNKYNSLREFGRFKLNSEEKILYFQNKPLDIPLKEIEILCILTENKGNLVSKETFLNLIWKDSFVEESNLSRHIYRLRKLFEEYGETEELIQTVPRRGYRFVGDVSEFIQEEIETELIYETSQTQEIYYEESSQTEIQTTTLSKFYVPILIATAFLALGVFAYWQWQSNTELRSFDSLRSIKLVSWKSLQSAAYSDYKVSSNGKMIAYSSTKEGNESIFIKQTNGGEDIRITKDEWHNFSPIWSSDDQEIAFVSVRNNQTGIYFCPSLGGISNLFKIIDKQNVSLISWSKDGKSIFYESEGNLFSIDKETKESIQITNFEPNKSTNRNFNISFDDKYIAYSDTNNSQTDIWVMQISGGKPFQITNDKETESRINWHPDGKRIIYSVSRDNRNQINLGYINGKEPLQITRGDNDFHLLDVSNDGTKIFYVTWEDKSDIWKVNTETGEETEVVNETLAEFWSEVSPDGKFLAYQINSNSSVINNIIDSKIMVKRLGNDSEILSVTGINPKWLSDNKSIAFLRWEKENQLYNLWKINIDNKEEEKITNEGVNFSGMALLPYNRPQSIGYSFSPMNNDAVFLSPKRDNVYVISNNSDIVLNITNNSLPNLKFYNPIYSKDGKKIVYVSLLSPNNEKEKPKWGVWFFENKVVKEFFSTDESLRLLGWADSENEVLLESTSGAMKTDVCDTNLLQISTNGKLKKLHSFKQIVAVSMALSSDGISVVFSKREKEKDNLYSVSIKSNEMKMLTNNIDADLLIGSPFWSTDSKNIYFDKQEKINTINVLGNFK
jgi:Tol biopolymer transport system component/DNA-binding winged helix-turn-helix (wHTH) protein